MAAAKETSKFEIARLPWCCVSFRSPDKPSFAESFCGARLTTSALPERLLAMQQQNCTTLRADGGLAGLRLRFRYCSTRPGACHRA